MNPLSSILLAATGIEADRSATFTSTVVIAGIVIVLGILVLLIFVFKAFGAIVHGAETRGKKKKLKAICYKGGKNEKNIALHIICQFVCIPDNCVYLCIGKIEGGKM